MNLCYFKDLGENKAPWKSLKVIDTKQKLTYTGDKIERETWLTNVEQEQHYGAVIFKCSSSLAAAQHDSISFQTERSITNEDNKVEFLWKSHDREKATIRHEQTVELLLLRKQWYWLDAIWIRTKTHLLFRIVALNLIFGRQIPAIQCKFVIYSLKYASGTPIARELWYSVLKMYAWFNIAHLQKWMAELFRQIIQCGWLDNLRH